MYYGETAILKFLAKVTFNGLKELKNLFLCSLFCVLVSEYLFTLAVKYLSASKSNFCGRVPYLLHMWVIF